MDRKDRINEPVKILTNAVPKDRASEKTKITTKDLKDQKHVTFG